jgi:hypothetical protein
MRNFVFGTSAVLGVAAALLSQTGASANDSAAAIGLGGLELVEQGDVAMLAEDLYVSRDKIRVRYRFRNESAAPQKMLVAFPLPEVDLSEMEDMNIGWPSDNQDDPVGFKAIVNGQSVAPKLERKALLKGKDVTAELKAAGVPLGYPFGDFWERVKQVKRSEIDKLAKKGIVEVHDQPAQVRPLWTLKSTYYWEQDFPSGEIVEVEHEYAPVIGGSFFTSEGFKNFEDLSADPYFAKFCVDRTTFAAIQKKLKAPAKGHSSGILSYTDIRYVLKTGRNWKGPIGEFKLTVDKGAPANIVSFCAAGVKKSGPTTFVVEKQNWEPDEDLAVMILQSIPQ